MTDFIFLADIARKFHTVYVNIRMIMRERAREREWGDKVSWTEWVSEWVSEWVRERACTRERARAREREREREVECEREGAPESVREREKPKSIPKRFSHCSIDWELAIHFASCSFILLHCALSVKMMLSRDLCTKIEITEIMRLKKACIVH